MTPSTRPTCNPTPCNWSCFEPNRPIVETRTAFSALSHRTGQLRDLFHQAVDSRLVPQPTAGGVDRLVECLRLADGDFVRVVRHLLDALDKVGERLDGFLFHGGLELAVRPALFPLDELR